MPTAPVSLEWVVVVPVKGTSRAKSRFGAGDHGALATAMALDTVEAARAAHGVAEVIVVTSPEAGPAFEDAGARVVVESEPRGLTAAIALGVESATAAAQGTRGVAVLLGDLPALAPDELTEALLLASAHERATVADAEGTGTVLITARPGATHAPAFGVGSNALHRAAGYVELDLPAESGLRSDVDTRERLEALRSRVGPRTGAELEQVARDR